MSRHPARLRRRWALCAGACLAALGLAACGPRTIRLPTDPGTPLADFTQVHAQVSAACTGVRTFDAELNLSGRAREERRSGRVQALFERPESIRLEGVAPIGPPAFILAGRDGMATLLLPRERRVVSDASPAEVLERLTGVDLSPEDLLAVLTGCVVPTPRAVGGRLHAGGEASLDLGGGAMLYLRRVRDAWEIRAARRGEWVIAYRDWMGGIPRSVRLRSDTGDIDLSATLAHVQINVDISPAAFQVVIPPGTLPASIEELRVQ